MHENFPVAGRPDYRPAEPVNFWQLIHDRDATTFKRASQLAYALARRHLADNYCPPAQLRQETEEVVQQTMLRLLRYHPKDAQQLVWSLDSVLLGFIRIVWLNRMRERQNERLVGLETVDLLQVVDTSQVSLHDKLVEEALMTAFDELQRPCRVALDMRYFQRASHALIAQTLGYRLKSVNSRLARCREYLLKLAGRHLQQTAQAG